MTTSTVQTIKEVLTKADPNEIADALRKCNLGNMFQVKMYDTGTITGVATVPLPESALHVLSARVVTSGTAASVGTYMVADNGVTPLLPPGGASAAIGIAGASPAIATGTGGVITGVIFPNTVTRVIFLYIAAAETAITTKFAP